MPFDFIDIKRVEIERLSVLYTDKQSGIDSKIKNLNLSLAATLNQENGNADFGLAADDVWFYMADTASLDVSMKKLSLDIDGSKNKDKIEGTMKSGITALNVTKSTDKLMINRDLQIELPLAVDIKKLFVDIKKGHRHREPGRGAPRPPLPERVHPEPLGGAGALEEPHIYQTWALS